MKDKERLFEFVASIPDAMVQDAIFKADMHVERAEKIAVSISGGADSDMMLDLLYRVDDEKKSTYIWFDTGLEYEATKRHLKDLEEKYGIEIVRLKAKKPIPLTVRQYGVPFLSKRVSDQISRLQRHNFKWEDGTLEELLKKYPKCKAALRWWCNDWGEGSKFNIAYNTWLKEFMMQNPPTFKISEKCCHFAKKSVSNDYIANGDFDLSCIGVRKAEGGARSTAYKSCFTPQSGGKVAQYRPLFWFDNASKECYKKCQNIKHSDCYEVWGMDRTGCAACPFGKNFEFELECIQKYEPKFYVAVNNIFGASYEYTRKYREFQKMMKGKAENGCMS